MKLKLLIVFYLFILSGAQAQIAVPSCYDAIDACDSVLIYPNEWSMPIGYTPITNYTVTSDIYSTSTLLIQNNAFQNPNPLSPSHYPCARYANYVRYWISITIENSGYLEMYFKAKELNTPSNPNGNVSPKFVWILYEDPNTPGQTGCHQIVNYSANTFACNTMSISNQGGPLSGFTGMSNNPAILPNTYADRREPSIYVNAGEKYLLFCQVATPINPSTNQPYYFPRAYFGNAIPGNENSTTTATFTCEPWTVPKEICAGDSAWVELSNTYNGYDDTYTYTFLNNAADVVNNSLAPWFQVAPSASTTYQVEVANNGTALDTLSFTVNVHQPPTPNAGPDLYLCEGDTAIFNGILSDTNNTFLWVNTDTSDYHSSLDSLTLLYHSQPGSDWLVLYESNGVCPMTADSAQLFTHPTPIVNLTSDTTLCIDGSAQLDATVTNTLVEDYIWSFPSDSSSQQSYSNNSSQWISVYAIDSIGCISLSDSVYINYIDSLNLGLNGPNWFCEGQEITFNSTLTGGLTPYTFNWFYNGNLVGTDSTLSFYPTGNPTLTLIANDACETPEDTVHVQLQSYPIPNLQLLNTDTTLCVPGEVNFEFTPSTLLQNWTWNLGDGSTLQNINPALHTYQNTGLFEVELVYTTTDNCTDTLNSISVEVIENPVANFNFIGETSEYDTQVSFSNTSSFSDYYSWTFENAFPGTSTQENPTTNFEEGDAGYYNVRLIAYNVYGCSDTAFQAINIYPEITLFAPNTFTPNGDESNNNWKISISGIDEKDFSIQIYNRWGELLYQSKNPNFMWDGSYNGKLVLEGTYIWTLSTSTLKGGERITRKGSITILK